MRNWTFFAVIRASGEQMYGTGVRAGLKDGGMEADMTEQEKEKAYMHWLYQAAGMGGRTLLRDLEQAGTAREIYEMSRKGILEEKLDTRYRKKAEKLQAAAADCDVMGNYEKMTARGISFISVKDADYPRKLAAVHDAPYALYYVGRLPDAAGKSIALIGTRKCSEYGRYMAKEFGAFLAQAGVQVVSGMARGIDGIGQRAALSVGGYSLGVFGCGVDICYPAENRELYEKLLAEGGVCSEYPPGIEPRAVLFPPRNRIISGLCDGVLVIEAKERSGTLITVDMALEQGREVYALPGRASDPLSAGCNRLIRQGAALVSSPQELLEDIQMNLMNTEGRLSCVQQSFFAPDGLQGEFLRLLDFQPKSLELLQESYRNAYGKAVTVPGMCHALLQLCAQGHAGQTAGCYYLRK